LFNDGPPGEARQITVVLAAEHPLLIRGMRSVLASDSSNRVVAEARHGGQACEVVELSEPDVLLLDLNMPGLPGLEVITQLSRRYPRLRIVAISAHRDVAHVSSALRSGACGYVLKTDPEEEISNAVREVVSGGQYLSPQLRYTRFEDYLVMAAETAYDQRYDRLTPREREVLHLVAEGHTNSEIAHSLSVSRRTVEAHRRNLQRKLGLNNVAELIRYALELSLSSSYHPQ